MEKQEKWQSEDVTDLFRVISKLKNTKEVQVFLRDLLTEKELLEFAQRWQAAKMLDKKVPYTQISEKTGLSSTTVARVAKWLNGEAGGYKMVLKRMAKKK